jgi:hypothetical protein
MIDTMTVKIFFIATSLMFLINIAIFIAQIEGCN